MDAIRVLGIEGLSVTMPHKADAAAACDELRGDAARLRSVNCVSRRDGGTLVGESTDGEGFLRSLRESGTSRGRDGVGARRGGAARAVVLRAGPWPARDRRGPPGLTTTADAAALASGIEAVSWDVVSETARRTI